MKIKNLKLLIMYSLLSSAVNAAPGECTLNGSPVNLNNGNDTQGKTGLVICKDEKGSVIREVEYKNGKQIGRNLMVQFDGSKKISTVNEAGNTIGKVQIYASNGKLITEENYVADGSGGLTKKQGLNRYFHQNNGKLKDLYWYQDDDIVFHASYGTHGKLTELKCGAKSFLKEDQSLCGFDGKAVSTETFDSNGSISQRTIYLKGKIQEQQTFSTDGKLAQKETFTGDDHQLLTYFPDGKVQIESNYKNGKLEGKEQEYFKDGKISRITTYHDDEKVVEEYFYVNGNKKSDLTFKVTKSGKETTKNSYWDTGKIQTSEKLLDSNSYEVRVGEFKNYYENGTIQSIQNYNNDGDLHGITQLFNINGTLIIESMYKNGLLVTQKEWNKDGKLVVDAEYFEDGSRKLKQK